MMKFSLVFTLLTIVLLGLGCDEYVPTPRPYAYPRIDLPKAEQRQHKQFDSPTCPLRFEYPALGKVTRDLTDSCWVDIQFQDYGLTWHLTVRDIKPGPLGVSPYFEDHRKLVYKHSKKASRIETEPFQAGGSEGVWFDLYGEVGTPSQVFLTDPEDRYSLVLSFYYQTATARDSLRPITHYMKEEMRHTLNTLRWE